MARRVSIIVMISALICGGYYFYMARAHQEIHLDAVAVSEGKADIGGPFDLIDQDGKRVTDQSLKGKKLLVFFGYTSCTDVCPVTMAVITEVMNQLASAGIKNVQPVFITTDPDVDKPAVIKKYLKDYYHGFIGLTGAKDAVEKVEKEYKVYAAAEPPMVMGGKSEDLSDHAGKIGHSALIYYMGADGEYLNNFSRESAPEDIVEKIEH